jgi:hypothetical protein
VAFLEGKHMARDSKGRFLPGPDPDRHILTRRDRQKGYFLATRYYKMPSRTRAWLWKKIRRYYVNKRHVG